jgi:hypothetical protein
MGILFSAKLQENKKNKTTETATIDFMPQR